MGVAAIRGKEKRENSVNFSIKFFFEWQWERNSFLGDVSGEKLCKMQIKFSSVGFMKSANCLNQIKFGKNTLKIWKFYFF